MKTILKATLIITILLATIYACVDLVMPEAWIPTPPMLRSFGPLFILPAMMLMRFGPEQLTDWCFSGSNRAGKTGHATR